MDAIPNTMLKQLRLLKAPCAFIFRAWRHASKDPPFGTLLPVQQAGASGTYVSLANLDAAMQRKPEWLHLMSMAAHGACLDEEMATFCGVTAELEKGCRAIVVSYNENGKRVRDEVRVALWKLPYTLDYCLARGTCRRRLLHQYEPY